MTLPTSVLAFKDCFDLMDRAIASDKGMRVKYENEAQAQYHQLRFNRARGLDRQANLKLYDEGHPMHGRSPYDELSVRRRTDGNGNWYLIILKLSAVADMAEVEELTDEDMVALLNPSSIPTLPAPEERKIEIEIKDLPTPQGIVTRRL